MVQKRACDACHKRKIQCHLPKVNDPCNWCNHHGLPCTFDRVMGRKKKMKKTSKPSDEQRLAEQLARIEDALAQAIARRDNKNHKNITPSVSTTSSPSPHPASATSVSIQVPTSTCASGSAPVSLVEQFAASESGQSPFISTSNSTFSSSASFGQIYYAGKHLGQISSHNGMPILSEEGKGWISARTGEDVSFSKYHHHFHERARVPPLTHQQFYFSSSELYGMPDRTIVEEFAELFFSSAFRLVFPVIDRISFEETVALAYEETYGRPLLERISAKGCVLAFLSIMCLFQGQAALNPQLGDADVCAARAYHLLSDVLEDASLLSLQTVFMLHLHQTFSGRLQSAAMLHAVACRMVFMLRGHTYTPVKAHGIEATRQDREVRQLRMLFWLCYIFDKDIALRTSQPPLMSGDYCDLTLPDDYMNCYFYLSEFNRSLSGSNPEHKEPTPHLSGDPCLSYLKEKTCRLLYSAQSLKKSDAEILRDIRELDDELERWRLSIPPDFRPALSISEKTEALLQNMKLPRSMRHISLHLEYHHLMTAIHRAGERCYTGQAESGSNESDRSQGIRSSIALSLEASRSTLKYLKAVVNGLADEAFWINVVFYPTSAIMTIFLNILHTPSDIQSKHDLELLCSVTGLITSIPVRQLTSHEIGHTKMVNEFVADLVRLAQCAISKATLEQLRK